MSSDIPLNLQAQARYQAGLVTRAQALASGMPLHAVKWKLKTGAWRSVHPGVYATFTGPVGRDAQLWAAVLHAGQGAYLSYATAAEINGLSDEQSPRIHVTIPASRRVTPPTGVVIHISSHASMVWRPVGIPPHTIAEETIIDLVNVAVDLDEVSAVVTAGFGRRLVWENSLRAVLENRKRLRWRGEFDEIITAAAGGAHSVLEYRHDRDVQRAHGLPESAKQAPFVKPDGTQGFRDRYYAAYRLAIELDGKRFHPDERRGQDEGRDNTATAGGGATLRYGWIDVTRKACETARQEADALRERGWKGTLKPCSRACRATGAAARRAPRRGAAQG